MTIGIIGTGWGARVQVPAFRSAGLTVGALAGRDLEKTRRIAEELGVPFATADWRELLTREDVRLVSIVTPPDLHAEIALAALGAGKHVLCEKPTALNTNEAQRMLAAAQARPAQLALIDHELRFLPALIHARELIAGGAIGTVRLVVALVIASSRADPQREWNWWMDASRGGGLLGASASHYIDTLRYLLGAEVTAVAASLDTAIGTRPDPDGVSRPVTADDAYSLRLRFANGTRMTVEGTVVARIDEPNSITLYGSEGTLRWVGGRLEHAVPGEPLKDVTPAHAFELPAGQRGDFAHGTVYLGHALRRYFEGEPAAIAPAATFVDGLRVQAVLDAAHKSHREEGRYIAPAP